MEQHPSNQQQQQQDHQSNNQAEVPNDPGKMFIGGLSWQTSPESLRDYFSKFGEITEVMVMKDPTTRRSRGFGFITFSDPASVDKVLSHGTHELDGKKIDPKVAFPRRAHPKMVTRTKKIFVGGLSAPTTLEDVKSYFEQFGPVSIHSSCSLGGKTGLDWTRLDKNAGNRTKKNDNFPHFRRGDPKFVYLMLCQRKA
ncbi:RNA-binding protein Musashi homolog Rbp6-like isoform X2 [Uranotaenia lowii]|uniref:RNA-binding protein Musashi homolog Rbp6-like isoform X2 n=1 Tax=Uranotaenia lowii TaxID=190385 RepID=UPI0024788286|nr:RNA-binding protein Musashi homolog Rbp6-like isoform X2 [Uranotaenia lowii]